MAVRKINLAHPGKNLREEFMESVGLSAYALAKALGVPLPCVNDIVREKRAISPEMAVLLSAYFGTSDGYWMNLQAHFGSRPSGGASECNSGASVGFPFIGRTISTVPFEESRWLLPGSLVRSAL